MFPVVLALLFLLFLFYGKRQYYISSALFQNRKDDEIMNSIVEGKMMYPEDILDRSRYLVPGFGTSGYYFTEGKDIEYPREFWRDQEDTLGDHNLYHPAGIKHKLVN